MTNIFEALRADHDIQRGLVADLLATTGDSPERRQLFDALRTSLEAHAAMEERHFYVPLMQHDMTQAKARHSVAEHKELDDFVEQLEEYQNDAPAWLERARDLEHRLLHHLEEEEHEVFQLAGRALGDDEKTELARSYRQGMDERNASSPA